MTLFEALQRANRTPQKGDFEFVRQIGGDGLGHLVIVTAVNPTGGVMYMCRCGGLPEIRDLKELEVVDQVTCLPCMI